VGSTPAGRKFFESGKLKAENGKGVARECASWPIILLATLFVAAGILHFVLPQRYEAIVPFWIPEHPLMVQLSGAAEVLGGIGLLIPVTRTAAGWSLIALLVAIFPANVEMLRQADAAAESSSLWRIALWMRLPLQGVLILWIGSATQLRLCWQPHK
jgi:uncharacterized membrane protein